MVSLESDWSSGASGMALDADIAIRLRPSANAKTPRIFMGFSFPVAVQTNYEW
jgi:hypothetical protein